MGLALLDTDTLSEVIKGRDPRVRENARRYLRASTRFTFSIITRYEILRGLKARRAESQMARFEERCQRSHVLPLTDNVIVRAAEIYASLHQKGQLISDADILIAATALENNLTMVTENIDHFTRITKLTVQGWRT